MNEGLDLIKIKRLAVIHLNNMFPVPQSQIVNFDIKKVKDQKYKALLQREYRVITSLENKIFENARKLYEYKVEKATPHLLLNAVTIFGFWKKKLSNLL